MRLRGSRHFDNLVVNNSQVLLFTGTHFSKPEMCTKDRLVVGIFLQNNSLTTTSRTDGFSMCGNCQIPGFGSVFRGRIIALIINTFWEFTSTVNGPECIKSYSRACGGCLDVIVPIKDVVDCDKLWRAVKQVLSQRFPNGETHMESFPCTHI